MLVTSLLDCPEFKAGDSTTLRELLHADKHPVDLRYSLAHARLTAGAASTPHRLRTSEVYYILSGAGQMHIDGESRSVAPNDMVYIPPGARQFIQATGAEELEFLCIVDPAWRAEDELVG
ncbi:MAG TPA: cupin domain-containing protein [Armatimonadota bacterium]|jgi:mannose-6-phosphate isomerase-like protein (cupin superfamily)